MFLKKLISPEVGIYVCKLCVCMCVRWVCTRISRPVMCVCMHVYIYIYVCVCVCVCVSVCVCVCMYVCMYIADQLCV